MKYTDFLNKCLWGGLLLCLALTLTPTQPSRADGPAPVEGLTASLTARFAAPEKPPLVLVHGWRGLDSSAPCLPTSPDPSNYPDSYWLHLDDDLIAAGFSVTYAKLITGSGFDGSTPGCSPVAETNVPHLIAAIDAALAANPTQDKVILIAHSMGGLVSRAYLESDAYRHDVAELYTMGTPHLGVPIDGLVQLITLITLGTVNLSEVCTSQPVVCQFSDNESLVQGLGFSGIASFNAAHNRRRVGVHYHLIGGDAEFGDRSNLGAIMDGFIAGDDDGIVPRSSALGIDSVNNSLGPLSGPYERRATYELHVESLAASPSLLSPTQRKHTYFTQDEYTGALNETLSEALPSETFTDCLTPVIIARLPDHRCQAGTIAPRPPARALPPLDTHLPTEITTLQVDQVYSRTIDLPGGVAMLFAQAEPGSIIRVTLQAPDGTRFDSGTPSTAMQHKSTPDTALFNLFETQPGEWILRIEGQKTPSNGTRLLTGGAYQSQSTLAQPSNQIGTALDQPAAHNALIAAPTDPSFRRSARGSVRSARSTQAASANQQRLVSRISAAKHTCLITVTNAISPHLAAGDTVQADFSLTLDSNGQYPEWLDYYAVNGPAGWPVQTQSLAPVNQGGWTEAMTQTFSAATGLAYWGFDYLDPADLNLAQGALPDPGTFWGPWRPDPTTSLDFSLTYALPDSLPRCPGSPFIGLPEMSRVITGTGFGDLFNHSVNVAGCQLDRFACPLPAIDLSMAVSPDGACLGSPPAHPHRHEQIVTLCYTLTNRSEHVALTTHHLTGTLTGVQTLSLTLAPGETHTLPLTATLTGSLGNCFAHQATWTARTEAGFGQPQASDTADPFTSTTYLATGTAQTTLCLNSPDRWQLYLPLVVK